jgi:hypothetical protein
MRTIRGILRGILALYTLTQAAGFPSSLVVWFRCVRFWQADICKPITEAWRDLQQLRVAIDVPHLSLLALGIVLVLPWGRISSRVSQKTAGFVIEHNTDCRQCAGPDFGGGPTSGWPVLCFEVRNAASKDPLLLISP